MEKLTRQHLADRLCEAMPMPPGRAMRVVNIIVGSVAEALASEWEVELRGIGSFRWYMRRPTRRRPPGADEAHEVPARPDLRFVPAKTLILGARKGIFRPRKGGSGRVSRPGRANRE